jgi:hypothetical protein
MVNGISAELAASIFKVEGDLYQTTRWDSAAALRKMYTNFNVELPCRIYLIPAGALKLQNPEGCTQFNAARLFALLLVVTA